MDLSTMVFRLANLEDYQSVMDINTDIYFGLDYLPSFYHQHIQDPRRMYMLAEIDSKVVSEIKSKAVSEINGKVVSEINRKVVSEIKSEVEMI